MLTNKRAKVVKGMLSQATENGQHDMSATQYYVLSIEKYFILKLEFASDRACIKTLIFGHKSRSKSFAIHLVPEIVV